MIIRVQMFLFFSMVIYKGTHNRFLNLMLELQAFIMIISLTELYEKMIYSRRLEL